MRRRVAKASLALAVNQALWVAVPYFLGTLLVGRVEGSPLTIPTFVYEFGFLFTVLEVGAAFFDGMAMSVPFLSGVAVLSAVYLWLVTNGGYLSINAGSIFIALDIRLLLYIFIVPSLWAAARAPLSYIVWKRALGSAPPPP